MVLFGVPHHIRTVTFISKPATTSLMLQPDDAARAAYAAALASASLTPSAAFAGYLEDDDEGFDVRIIAVLFLPLTAVSWALFNIWRVFARQLGRQQQGSDGSPWYGGKYEG